MNSPTSWIMMRVLLHGARQPNPMGMDVIASLNELAAILTSEMEDIGGAELQERFGASVMAELCIYTVPSSARQVEHRIERLAAALALSISIEREFRHDEPWHDTWKQFYRPLTFGCDLGAHGLLVRPSWLPAPAEHHGHTIRLDPGRAFGTGQHETTQLCLEMLCRLAAMGYLPNAILDLGCGSGILAIASARMFPDARVWAADDDPEATATTVENAAFNDVEHRIHCHTGTLETMPPGQFELIIANIRPKVLKPIAGSMRRRLSAGGRVILSGILTTEVEGVEAAYGRAGLRVHDRQMQEGWVALQMQSTDEP